MPRPEVTSAVSRRKKREKPPVEVKDVKLMFALIRASFNQRRKTLGNGLKNAGLRKASGEPFSKEEINAAILALGKGENVRGETLTLEEFAALADLLCDGPAVL